MKFSHIVPSGKESIDNLTVSFEDGFEIITMYGHNQSGQSSSLYPLTPNLPYSVNPSIPTYAPSSTVPTCSPITGKSSHPLDGIPFKLSPALEMSTFNSSDPILEDVKNTLNRVGKLLYSEEFKYDCRLEKDVLGEN
ncbi:uncharacterized protein LOC135831496 [Planococcus citri]|uniref:uncharacterized protein LOC135831496 n=1 Tax=Planococcus citri TaxID=170843 RepID=UPI0031F72738